MTELTSKRTNASLAKIAITQDADTKLEAMLAVVNQDNRFGRVGKRELASWIIKHFAPRLQSAIAKIQLDHLDDFAFLRNAQKEVKRAIREGLSDENVRELALRRFAELRRLKQRSAS